MALLPKLLKVGTNIQAIKRGITMSAQLRCEKAMEQLKNKNPYYEKYASKLAALQETNPEEFLEKLNNVTKPTKKEVKKAAEKPRDYSELLNPKGKLDKPTSEIPHKKLSDIMKVELMENKTAEEIKQIWLDYHKQKEVLVATMTVAQYEKQMSRGKEHPMFIVPLPRSEGFEFFLFQFTANTVHFTPLLCYQVHKENAPECLGMVYYTELKDKDIVLMRAEFDNKVVNVQEAQCLANQLQLYYAQDNKSKLDILEKFTKDPANFKHMDVIAELENLTL